MKNTGRLFALTVDVNKAFVKHGAYTPNMDDLDIRFHKSKAGPVRSPVQGRKSPKGLVGPRSPVNGVLMQELMGERGLSCKTLGDEIEMSASSIYRYLNNKESPTESIISEIASALGTTYELLIRK